MSSTRTKSYATGARVQCRTWTSIARRYWQQRDGSVAVHIGLMLIAVIGFVSLGTEITFLLLQHRQMQATADAAATSGARALAAAYPSDPTIEAHAVAAYMGYVDGVAGASVAVHHPPLTGSQAGNASAIEVDISQPQTLYMVSLFRSGIFSVGTRAVAMTSSEGLYCMLALDPMASGALAISNNAIVTNPKCGVAVNSNSNTAITLSNNAAIDGPVNTHGNWSLSNNAALNGSPLVNHGPVIADPYAGVPVGATPGCTAQSGSGKNNVTVNLTPGHFCSGWSYSNNATVNLASGTYYVDLPLSLKNNVVVNGMGGVTIVINGNYAIDVGNNAQLNITAPSSGNFAGLAFFGTRTGTTNVSEVFSNNTTLNIKGVIYFPSNTVEIDNNGSTTSGGCTNVIAEDIRVHNNVELDNNCTGTGVQPLGTSSAYLVE